MRIMIVEDEAYSRTSLAKYAREYTEFQEAEILETQNGTEGWKLFQEKKPDLVISDIRMPLMDGIQLAKMISESAIPAYMVIITGYAEFEYAQKAISYGVSEYLLKPVSRDELYTAFSRYTVRSGLVKESAARERNVHLDVNNTLAGLLTRNKQTHEDDLDEYTRKLLSHYWIILIRFDKSSKDSSGKADVEIRQYLNSPLEVLSKLVVLANSPFNIILVEETDDSVKKIFLHRITHILRSCESAFEIGVCYRLRGAESLHDAFVKAEYALDSRLIRPGEVFYFEKEALNNVYLDRYNRNILSLLRSSLALGTLSKCRHLLHSSLEEMRKTPHISVQSVTDFIKGVERTFNACLMENGQQMEIPRFELIWYDNLEELESEMDYYVRQICQFYSEQAQSSPKSSTGIVEIILEYIEQNYGENFTLKYLAENVLFMNCNYLSFILKEKTGKNFSECLQEARMQHALELVKESQMSVTKIAGLCGYNDISRFIQVFKNTYGDTPKRFRVKRQKESR